MFNATFIVSLISFLLFIFIMNQILYKPINEIIEKRKKVIDDNYNIADENQKKSEAILQDRLDKLKNARNKVKEETSAAINAAKKEQSKIQEDAKNQIKIKINESISSLNEDELKAVDTLKEDIIDLAQMISDKFIETSDRITNINHETIEKIMKD